MAIIQGVALIVCFTKFWGWVSSRKIHCTSFDDFLARLGDQERLHNSTLETNARYRLQVLEIELRFLKTFSKCIVRVEGLKACSSPVISAIKRASWGLFSRSKTNAFNVAVSNALEAIDGNRTNIRYIYELVPVLIHSFVHMPNDLLVEFMEDLMKDLEDLLSYKVNLVLVVKQQFLVLKEDLMFLRNFLDFATNQCGKHAVIERFSVHIEGVAIDAACLVYSCWSDKVNGEKLADLLQKTKPIKPEVREMYIQVLRASKQSVFPDEQVLGAIKLYLQYVDSMLQMLNLESSFKLPEQDQLKKFNDGLRFLRSLLLDPPRFKIAKKVNKLLRSIDAMVFESGCLLFNLYVTNEDIAEKVNLMLVDLLEKMKYIMVEVRNNCFEIPKPLGPKCPKTDGLGFIRFFLENLKEMLISGQDSINFVEHLKTILKDFELLASVLGDMEDLLHEHEELKTFLTRVLNVAYDAEYVIDSFVSGDGPVWCHLFRLDDIVEKIQLIKADASQIHLMLSHETRVSNMKRPSSSAPLFEAYTPIIKEQIVGFEEEAEKVIELIVKGPSTQMDTVSIVGMPGLGKTTLAKKVYNSISAEKHFHVRAWCTVSQVYEKKDLLLSLLDHIIVLQDQMKKLDVDELAHLLYKSLKGRRYLVIMDDVWNIEAWHDFRISFPEDENGSRVLFTTRVLEVASKIKLHSHPYSLSLLSDDACWELLKKLVFSVESCPRELEDTGKQIAKSCKGLPLCVVLIASVLVANKTKSFWVEIARSLTSRIINDPTTQSMDIIGLSYKHLPNHLKPCFLYFGAFLEDQEVHVRKLACLWSAEGLLRKIEGKRIEDTVEDYLKDLQNRSLLIVSKRRADGGIKRCRVHDLLSQFCKAKSKEECFWQFGYENIFTSDGFDHGRVGSFDCCTSTSKYEQRRLCLHPESLDPFIKSSPSGTHVRSLLFFAKTDVHFLDYFGSSFISGNFKLLSVLNFEDMTIGGFPTGLDMLVHLKHLGLRFCKAKSFPTARANPNTNLDKVTYIPPSIASLGNLESLAVLSDYLAVYAELKTISKLRKLRHLRIRPLIAFIGYENEYPPFVFEDQRQVGFMQSDVQDCLETISLLFLPRGREEVFFRKFPNIRELRCAFKEDVTNHSLLNFNLLNKLENLNMLNFDGSCELSFPSTLTKLTLYSLPQTQAKLSVIGVLENLKVLKLRLVDIMEKRWHIVDGEFPKLEHLQMAGVNLEEWSATSSDNFPRLQRLQLFHCEELEEIPSCLGSVQTLEMIEVKECKMLDEKFVREIQQEQVDLGNDEFKLRIIA